MSRLWCCPRCGAGANMLPTSSDSLGWMRCIADYCGYTFRPDEAANKEPNLIEDTLAKERDQWL